ncbi:MAG: hypothetical protein ACR2MX_07315 [Cyclobacteriaceae bacterium]
MLTFKNRTRRAFIKTGIGAFLLATIVPIKAWGSNKNPYLLKVFNDENIVQTIGRKYLQQFPNEKAQLEQLLAGINDMNRQSAKEFQSARCVTVDGWVLSKSEARECAWYYLKNFSHAY